MMRRFDTRECGPDGEECFNETFDDPSGPFVTFEDASTEIARLTAERDEALSGFSLRRMTERFARAAERNVELERERDEWKGKAEEAQRVAVWAVKNARVQDSEYGVDAFVDWPDCALHGWEKDPEIYRAILEASKGGVSK